MVALFLEEVGPEDDRPGDGSGDGDDQHSTSCGVLGLACQGVKGRGGKVCEALDGGVEKLGGDDATDTEYNDAPLRRVDAKPPPS